MGTKLNPGAYDCHARALPDEPTFTLLARDPVAPDLVREWAELRHDEIGYGERPDTDIVAVQEAHVCARDMEVWRKANDGRWRTEKAPPEVNEELLTVPDLLAALRESASQHETSAEQFAYYVESHMNKSPPDKGKAISNEAQEKRCRNAAKAARAAIAKAEGA
jgi:hypothetical protein